jgi:sodium-dependent dicarboxylate transporter 2/3/5
LFFSGDEIKPADRIKDVMRKQLEGLGRTSTHEWSIFISFITLIFLWFFREPMFIDGWGDLLQRKTDRGTKSTVGDATPALLMVMVIFALPTHYKFWPFQSSDIKSKKSPALVSWELIEKKLPWGVILLLGGGFALSDACTKTGDILIEPICFATYDLYFKTNTVNI